MRTKFIWGSSGLTNKFLNDKTEWCFDKLASAINWMFSSYIVHCISPTFPAEET